MTKHIKPIEDLETYTPDDTVLKYAIGSIIIVALALAFVFAFGGDVLLGALMVAGCIVAYLATEAAHNGR